MVIYDNEFETKEKIWTKDKILLNPTYTQVNKYMYKFHFAWQIIMSVNVKKVKELKWNLETENIKDNPGMLMFCKGRTTWQEIIELQAAMVKHSGFCGLLA